MTSTPLTFPTVTVQTSNGPIVVPCEPINDWFAITPVFAIDENLRAFLSGRFTITHRQTGMTFADGPGCIECCRRAGKELDALGINWSQMTAENSREFSADWADEVKRAVMTARSVAWGCDAEYCEPSNDSEEIKLTEVTAR